MYGGLITFLPLLAGARHLGNAGLFFTVYAIVLIVLRSLAGRLADRFGPVPVVAPGMACGVASMWVLATAGSLAQMLIAAVLFAFAMGLVQPPSLAWGMELAGERRATAMATMVMAQDLGILIGGTVLGAVGTLGGYGWLFAAGGVAGVVALAGIGVAGWTGRLPAVRRGAST
jgi:MFS family permease